MRDNIRIIHDSDYYGSIIEIGCAAPLANSLLEVSGASKTIYKSEQPYSKELQEERYGKFKRSVSKDFIDNVLNKEIQNDKINFVFASSWQLPDFNNPKQYCHGYIGVLNKKENIKHILHYSFLRRGNDRKSQRYSCIEDIGILSENILYNVLIENNVNLIDKYKNIILDQAYTNNEINYDLLLNNLYNNDFDYPLCFHKMQPVRFEEILRKSNNIIINKGSFNPVHHKHIEIVKIAEKKYNGSGAFLISVKRYDKPFISKEEILERIKMFNDYDYPLIICKSMLFYETFDMLNEFSSDENSFKMVMGSDTLNRIYITDVKDFSEFTYTLNEFIVRNVIDYKDKFKFCVYKRLGHEQLNDTHLYDDMIEYINEYEDDGTSSTKIRNKIKI